jgi:LemA protein
MPILILGLVIIVGLLLYVFLTYNKFVTTKTRIKASTQEIGNQLKRQAELIPNLVSAVKGYMKHEKKIFGQITAARKAATAALDSADLGKMVKASEKLQTALAPIRAVFESTPELQAAKPTAKLMEELRDTADKLMYARRTLIDLTADFNVMVATLPSKFVASLFGFKEMLGLKTPEEGEHLTVKKEETKTPKVKL